MYKYKYIKKKLDLYIQFTLNYLGLHNLAYIY